MKITKKQLRRIIKEAILKEAKEWPGDSEWIAMFAPLIQDQQWDAAAALMFDLGFSYSDIQLELDDGEWHRTMDWKMEDAGTPLPRGWQDKVNNAAWKVEDKRIQAATAADPDADWLEFLGRHWTSMIEPDDMPGIKWKPYKRYIRLSPPRSISHGVGEININREDYQYDSGKPGTWDEFKEFLEVYRGVLPEYFDLFDIL